MFTNPKDVHNTARERGTAMGQELQRGRTFLHERVGIMSGVGNREQRISS